MLHDPEVYPNPMDLIPERYGNSEAEMKKVKDLAFGFGRRVCPGMHLAEGTLFLIIATTLATCNVLPALDDQGQPILPVPRYTNGTIRYGFFPTPHSDSTHRFSSILRSFPENFPYRLLPRSEKAVSLLSDISTDPE